VNTLRRAKVSASVGFLSLSIFLVASTAFTSLHAQTPAAGTSVVVKMLDPVDSSHDPGGKQYRASVTKAVTAANGTTIDQGSAATVTLTSSGSGFSAQLVSVTVNGQPVAVTSSSASVTAAAQTAAGNAINSVNSVLGGFGHHVNTNAATTAVATGQRVLLPPGTTLTFVLSQPPAPSQASPAAQSAPAAGQMTASATPAPRPAGTPLSAQAYYTLCRYQGQQDGHPIIYVTPIIHTDRGASDISLAFNQYMSVTYDIMKIQQGSGYCRTVSNSADQQAYTMQQLEKQWADSKTVVTHIDWTGTPDEIAATNAKVAARTSAQSAAAARGLFVFCATSGAAGIDIYYTAVFQTPRVKPSRPIGTYVVDESIPNDFYAYLTQKGYKFVKPGSFRCVVNRTEEAAKASQHAWAYGGSGGLGDSCCGYGKIVETGWKE
jgi:hypothetical protein